MNSEEFCNICKNPKKSGNAGSFTQWIATCSCDLKEIEEAQKLSVRVCMDCGKRIGKGRQGSFTQFIFRAEVCDCARPTPSTDLLESIEDSRETAELEYSDAEPIEIIEDELEINESDFPVSRYKPIQLLGTGTTGVVYKARDRLLNKLVAVKTMNIRSAEQLVKFQEEAKATNNLKHPSIVQVLDFGVTKSEVPYMVLEYLEADSLKEVLAKKGSLHWRQAQSIISQMCQALTYAHSSGIYHRDLKPQNILLKIDDNENVSVKIIDFGLAKITGKELNTQLDDNNTLVGTPFYMSPDQGLGLPYDSRSEIYSFGCVLFEILTGKLPFVGETSLQTLNMHANEPAPRLSDVTGTVFLDEIESLVAKCLEKDPEDRFRDFVELEQYLDKLASKENDTDAGVLQKQIAKSFARENRLRTYLILISFMLLVVAGLYLVYNSYLNAIDRAKENKIVMPGPTEKETKEVVEKLSVPVVEHLFVADWKFKQVSPKVVMAQSSGISDEDFKTIAGRKNLSKIKVGFSDQVTGEGLKYLKGVDLTSLAIISTAFNNEGAKNLSLFPNLKSLSLKYCDQLSESGMENISNLSKLKRIQLWNIKLPKNALAVVSRMKSLTTVDLGNSKPYGLDDLKHLVKMPNLRTLKLSGNKLVDDSFTSTLAQTKVTTFLLNDTSVTMKTVKALAKRKQTKMIRVRLGDSITIPALAVEKTHRPDINFFAVDMFNTRITIK